MNNIFDNNTPLEALPASLRKIIYSTTGPSSKQRPRLTVGLMEAGKAIINQLEKRATCFVTPATTEHRAVQTISSQPKKQQDASQEERKCQDPPFQYSNADPNLVLQQQAPPISYAEAARTTILLYPKEGNKETSLRKLLQKEV
ncbi:hypothetical protein AVEN_31553-1 [Araneus ventricosus]|uniref:Uncharacterized protein n=1 Tax=Araneus ventricosus TaxID=182803 RepID=A0A4Y2B0V2_ARAVE|nr:hypothetical protein AVEN_31553-1 [Araneus ventricosus]